MTKHTHGLSVTRIAGEGIDADYVEQPREFCDPSYPICPGCDEESDDDRGWCSSCQDFVSNQPAPMSLEEWQARHPEVVREIHERLWGAPYTELKRTGTGGWL